MTGPSWLIDSKRIATKIKSASGSVDPSRFNWKSNPSKTCPRCSYIIDNTDVVQEWPGLPRGVKFDPSDQELVLHLVAKVGPGGEKPHPFIDEFIPTVEEDDGICYTHPQKLPGVKQDGNLSHFFHRTFKAYNSGSRKRRKIYDDFGDVRWHKTGKTKPVIMDGKHLGYKKIMVLYVSAMKGGKPEKTNWVMHQYHIGIEEDEKDGEYVVSKVFYQQLKPLEKNRQDMPSELAEADVQITGIVPDDIPVEGCSTDLEFEIPAAAKPNMLADENEVVATPTMKAEDVYHETADAENYANTELTKLDSQDNLHTDDAKWWEGESQFLLDSQQLAEGIAMCDELLQSQSSYGGGEGKNRPRFADYAYLGVENLKRDLEECQKLKTSDPSNLEPSSPPDMRLSQLEFGSQDSFLTWAGSKLAD